MWKQPSYLVKPDLKKLSTTLPKPKNLSILPILVKDRPFSEDNVTHQIAGIQDIQVLGKEKLMSSISNNRELSTLRKKLNPIQSQNNIFTDLSNNKYEGQKLDPLQNTILEEKKGYVEKIRRGMIEAKKFDNPALYEAIKIEQINDLEEIKDEINVNSFYFIFLNVLIYKKSFNRLPLIRQKSL